MPARPNKLHEFSNYNFTIVLSAYRDIDFLEINEKTEIDLNSDKVKVIAATGGTYNFKNSILSEIDVNKQLKGDYFIDYLQINSPIIVGPTAKDTIVPNNIGLVADITIKEVNGFSFLNVAKRAYTLMNPAPPNSFESRNPDAATIFGGSKGILSQYLLSIVFNKNITQEQIEIKENEANVYKAVHSKVSIVGGELRITETGSEYRLKLQYFSGNTLLDNDQKLQTKNILLTGKTVREMLDSLIAQRNEISEKTKSNVVYKIEPTVNDSDLTRKFFDSYLVDIDDEKDRNQFFTQMTSVHEQQLGYPLDSNKGSGDWIGFRDIVPGQGKTAQDLIKDREGGGTDPYNAVVNSDVYRDLPNKPGSNTEPGKEVLQRWWTQIKKAPPKMLSQMTIAEVKQFQEYLLNFGDPGESQDIKNRVKEQQIKKNVSNPDTGYASSAVGAYQITNETLRGLLSKSSELKDITDSTIFSQAIQDRIAEALWNERGAQPWEGLKAPELGYPSAFKKNGSSPLITAESRRELYNKLKGLAFSTNENIAINVENRVESVLLFLLINSQFFIEKFIEETNLDDNSIPKTTYFLNLFLDLKKAGSEEGATVTTITYYVKVKEILSAVFQTSDSSRRQDRRNSYESKLLKDYNYLFSGKNIDILNLDLNFNNISGYFFPVEPTFNFSHSAAVSPDGTTPEAGTSVEVIGVEETGGIPMTTYDPDAAFRNSPLGFYRNFIAPLTSNSPLATLRMDVVGDFDFLPKSYLDGYDYLTGTLIKLNIGIADPSSSTGKTQSNDFLLYDGAMFSAYYQLARVESVFESSGQFKSKIQASILVDQFYTPRNS